MVGQALTLLMAPLLTRLFTPADMGILSVYLSVASLFLVFSTGKYELAVPLPRDDESALGLASLALRVAVVVSAFVLLGSVLYGMFFGGWAQNPELDTWIWFMSISVFSLSATQVCIHILLRRKQFVPLSRVRVVEAFFMNVLPALIYKIGHVALLVATLAAHFLSFTYLYAAASRHVGRLRSKIRAATVGSVARAYADFPRNNILQSFTDMFQVNGLVFLIPAVTGNLALAGLYGLAIRILQAPLWIVVNPIAQVFYSEAARHESGSADTRRLLGKALSRTALLTLPVPVVLLAAGPQLFSFVFGEEWHDAGMIARIVSPWLYLDYLRTTAVRAVIIRRRQHTLLRFSLVANILLAGAFLAGTPLGLGFHGSLVAVSVSQSAMALVILAWALSLKGHSGSDESRDEG